MYNVKYTYGQFAGFILAQYYKGYDSIALSGADAYLCSDDPETIIVGSTTHIWNDADNGMLDRWVAYLYYNDNYSFASVTEGLCPRTILVSGNCNTITIDYNRLTALYIPDGIGTLGTFDLNTAHTPGGSWNKIQVIKNYEHSTKNFFYNASGVVCVEFSDLKTISTNNLFYGVSNVMSALETVSLPELEEIYQTNIFTTGGQSDFGSMYSLNLPKLRYIYQGSILNCPNNSIGGKLQEVHLPSLEKVDNDTTVSQYRHIVFNTVTGLKRVYFDTLEKTSFISGNGLFNQCHQLEYLYFGYKDNDRTKSVTVTATYSSNLTDIELKDGYLKNFICSTCNSLTEVNIVNHILNKLGINQDFIDNPIDANKLTITLGATNLAKLTSEEMQIAIDKGFTLA